MALSFFDNVRLSFLEHSDTLRELVLVSIALILVGLSRTMLCTVYQRSLCQRKNKSSAAPQKKNEKIRIVERSLEDLTISETTEECSRWTQEEHPIREEEELDDSSREDDASVSRLDRLRSSFCRQRIEHCQSEEVPSSRDSSARMLLSDSRRLSCSNILDTSHASGIALRLKRRLINRRQVCAAHARVDGSLRSRSRGSLSSGDNNNNSKSGNGSAIQSKTKSSSSSGLLPQSNRHDNASKRRARVPPISHTDRRILERIHSGGKLKLNQWGL